MRFVRAWFHLIEGEQQKHGGSVGTVVSSRRKVERDVSSQRQSTFGGRRQFGVDRSSSQRGGASRPAAPRSNAKIPSPRKLGHAVESVLAHLTHYACCAQLRCRIQCVWSVNGPERMSATQRLASSQCFTPTIFNDTRLFTSFLCLSCKDTCGPSSRVGVTGRSHDRGMLTFHGTFRFRKYSRAI
jgi:hypothetical protein